MGNYVASRPSCWICILLLQQSRRNVICWSFVCVCVCMMTDSNKYSHGLRPTPNAVSKLIIVSLRSADCVFGLIQWGDWARGGFRCLMIYVRIAVGRFVVVETDKTEVRPSVSRAVRVRPDSNNSAVLAHRKRNIRTQFDELWFCVCVYTISFRTSCTTSTSHQSETKNSHLTHGDICKLTSGCVIRYIIIIITNAMSLSLLAKIMAVATSQPQEPPTPLMPHQQQHPTQPKEQPKTAMLVLFMSFVHENTARHRFNEHKASAHRCLLVVRPCPRYFGVLAFAYSNITLYCGGRIWIIIIIYLYTQNIPQTNMYLQIYYIRNVYGLGGVHSNNEASSQRM